MQTFLPYPDPGMLTFLQDIMGKEEGEKMFYKIRSYLLQECRLWEGPYGDYLLLEPHIIGAEK